jgi:hypothetical protein
MAAGIAGLIYILTRQSGPETLSTQAMITNLFPAAFPKHYNNAIWLYLGLNSARRMAHVYEFAALGFWVNLMYLTAPFARTGRYSGGKSLICSAVWSTVICFIMSLTDQIHKTFIVYRHFDAHDLLLDATGYIGITLFLCSIIYIYRYFSNLIRTVFKKEVVQEVTGYRSQVSAYEL